MHQSLWREIWILVGIAALSLLLGLVTGRPFLIAAIGYGIYIGSTLRQLRKLHQWLLARKQTEVPEAEGLWGDVFAEIRKLERQAERREDRLTGMIDRFQNAAAAMPDAVTIVSQTDEIEWANRASGSLLGIHFPRDTGMRLGNLIRNPEFASYLQGNEFGEPLELVSPESPERHLSIQIIPFGASQKLIIGRDVTRLVKLEQMRRNFVANVSHEMRTPLTVLAGYIETLRDMQSVTPQDLKKHLATMHEQANRMQRLVGDLLALSRLETEPPRRHDETVDVAALLAQLKKEAELLSGANQHRITLSADAGLKLLGSREELHSAFSNLIDNAVRYTPPGGSIMLTWDANGGGARFSVSDTGDGIAPEHIAHLTERFYRVDTARSRATGGTGLGLSIVKHVLLRHNAQLLIESTLGKGSTFTCVFPAKRLVRQAAARRSG